MRHPRHCLANHPDFSSNITHLQWHATHINHASTQPHNPPLPRSRMSQTLARHQHHPTYPRQQATHTCIPPTLACHSRKQATTLPRYQRKHATRATLFCSFQSTKSPIEFNSLLQKLFCYVSWFDERRNWRPCKRGLFIKSQPF